MSILDYFFYDPSRDEGKAKRANEEAMAGISSVQDPNYQPVEYTSPEYAGDVTPEEAQAYTMGSTAMEGISTDPALRGSQMSQIAALENLRDQGGMNLTDKANLQRIQNEEMGKELSQRQSIMEQARQRGTGGSGMELMALLNSNQAGTNRQSQRDLEIAGMAQDRALQAGGQAASLAGNVRGQDFSQESQIAAAKDAAAKFNASMMSGTNQFNVGNQLRAAQGNQSMRQGVSNIGAENRNKQETMNKYTMPGQQFSDTMAKEQALANLKSGEANRYQTKANQGVATQGQLWGNLAGGATSVLGNMYTHDKGPFAPDKVAPNNGYSYEPYSTDESWKNQKYNRLDF
jgi:hypothetical protein